MTEKKIAVKSNGNEVSAYKWYFLKHGFVQENDKYTKYCRHKREILKIKEFCRKNRLKFLYDNEYGERSSDYRKTFFQNNTPVNGKYMCVYCGRYYPKEKITVDHLYPANKVSQNEKLQKRLKKQGIDSLNDTSNLVAACFCCNRRKSDKTGWWIFLGKIGRYKWLWRIRHILTFMILAAFVYLMLCLFLPGITIESLKWLNRYGEYIVKLWQQIF
jgi:5-methylcytosine-specific restriction endonuclease McrA